MKRILSIALLLIVAQFSFAQLVATNDTTICTGQQVQLNATGGTTYTWTNANTLSNSTVANPVATPTGTTTYVVSSQVNTGNIFVNGDFSQGNTGFTSGYAYTLPPNIIGNPIYWVGGNPTLFSSGMVNCSDHTAGVDTNQLIADGATVANTAVWCQTVSVVPNTVYSLSGYMHPLNNSNMPGGYWSVNGTTLSGSSPTPFIPCQWTNFTATWNSGVNTSATFCAYSNRLQANGNDFAIDDLSLTATVNYTDSVTVTVANPPVVFLGNDTSICVGSSVTLDAKNAGSTFLWNDNSTLQTLSINSASTYSVTVTNTTNCSASDFIAVNNYSLTVTPTTVNTTCGNNNGSVTLNYSGGFAPYSFVWSNSSTNDSIENLAAGSYSVTVSDITSCSTSVNAVVNPSGTGSINITSNASQICASDTATICAPSGYASYLWNTGAITTCIYPSQAGNYYVTVTDNTNCSSTSNHVAIAVYPVPPVSVSVNGDTLNAFNATAYQWYYNGSEIIGAIGSTHIALQSGNYTVQVTDTNGCTALSNQLQIVVSGIEDLVGDTKIEIYPNPNTVGNWQLVVGNSLLGKDIEIVDVAGKTIWKSEIGNRKSEIQLSIASGVYLLKIISGRNTYLKKLVKL